MLPSMIRASRRSVRARSFAIAAIAFALSGTILTTVTAPVAAQSRTDTRFAVANAASLSDMGTAASLVAAGDADAVLFAQTATELGPQAALVVAQHTPSSAVLVGGKAVLSDGIETELRRWSPEIEISRLAGADRIDTAARAARLSATAGSDITAVIAYGWSLPDVGTAASLVATGGGDVVLYSYRDRLGQPSADAIARLRPARLVVVGGPAAVAPAVVAELAAVSPGTPVTRRQGATRIETATAAAAPAFDSGAAHAVIANGWSERDVGIAASLAAADSSAAVLYTNRRGDLPDAVATVINERKPVRATLVGDATRLPPDLIGEITARSPRTRIERLGELECAATVGEAAARAAVLASESAPASPPGGSEGELTVAMESCAQHYLDGAFEVRFRFSSPLKDFDDSDLDVVNGEVRHVFGDGARYHAVIEPTAPGAVMVRILRGAVRSTDGTRNEASAPFVRVFSPSSGLPAAGLDTWNRPLVLQAYEDEFERDEPDAEYTGNLNECLEGTTGDKFRRSVVQRANWYRAMAGLDPVMEDPELSQGAQATALMMLAEGKLSHYPEREWACHSDLGAAVAAASNLGLGNAGVSGIDSYMRDAGDNNLPVGHRRWILYPQLLEVGTGNTWHLRSRYRRANALDVLGGDRTSGLAPVRATRGFVAWPPPGYVPAGVVWGRWSFSLADAEFEDATVGIVDESGPIAAKILARGRGAGDPGIVWAVAGDRNSNLVRAPRDGDRCYSVTIEGVRIDGERQTPYEYPVCVIDPRAPTGPRVSVSSDSTNSVGGAFEVTFEFSDDVDGFTRHDIDVYNGSVTEFSGSGSRYDAAIRADDNGAVVVSVHSGGVHDARNRPNEPSAPLVRTADVGRPVASISSTSRSVLSGSFDVDISFSEPVTGFERADIRVVNGTATSLSGSGDSYRAAISPASDGTVMVRVLQDAAVNADGRANAASHPFTRLRSSGGRGSGIGLDTWDRSAAVDSYAAEFDRDEPDPGFTGDVGACERGTTSSEFRSGVLQRLNWYRAAAGLNEVSENATHTTAAQHVALTYLANEQFTFTPSAACYTAEAERASSGGLAALGRSGWGSIDAFVRSSGNHLLRRSVLTPHLRQIGIGHAGDPDSRYRRSLMLYTDHGDAWNAIRPPVREVRGFVAWPPAGFVAEDLVPRKWSFSLANADYSDAEVAVVDHVGPLTAKVIGEDDWYREHSLVWEVDVSATAVRARQPTGADHCFAVRIGGVRIGNVAQEPFEYAVCTAQIAD